MNLHAIISGQKKIIQDLVDWAAFMGGFDSECWDVARHHLGYTDESDELLIGSKTNPFMGEYDDRVEKGEDRSDLPESDSVAPSNKIGYNDPMKPHPLIVPPENGNTDLCELCHLNITAAVHTPPYEKDYGDEGEMRLAAEVVEQANAAIDQLAAQQREATEEEIKWLERNVPKWTCKNCDTEVYEPDVDYCDKCRKAEFITNSPELEHDIRVHAKWLVQRLVHSVYDIIRDNDQPSTDAARLEIEDRLYKEMQL